MAGKDTRAAVQKTEIIDSMTKLLNSKIDPISEKLEKLNKLDTIENSVGFALEEVKKIPELETSVNDLNRELKQLSSEVSTLKKENATLKEELLKQELYSRKNNIKIFGLKDTTQDNLEEKILTTIQGTGISLTSRDIERVHFLGPPVTNRIRPVIVRFHYFKDKALVMTKKDSLRERSVYLSEDFPQEIQERRRIILPIFFKAIEVCPQLTPRLRVDSIILAGKVYNINNLDSLPVKDLLPQNVFTPSESGVTAFFTKNSPLSNHFSSKFSENGISFLSAEQSFMYKKAMHFKDHTTAQNIIESTTPGQAKQLGKNIQGFRSKEWSKVSEEFLFTSMHAKFSQNDQLRSFLLQTGKTQLVEASPTDKVWGAGLSLNNTNIFIPDHWKGKNLAGKVLMRVRQTLQ